ncbi:MAG: hypothetical protein DRO06_00060 [Thermoproteota archaeon]|nr:MAG: hypothetical protein DRO06_00060 [Candidatus Korarchaeota archaeon]
MATPRDERLSYLIKKAERVVIYDEEMWGLLRRMRERALQILRSLERVGLRGAAYGSVARGDVDERSDLDIVLLDPPSSPSMVEELVSSSVGPPMMRKIVQANPQGPIKVYLYITEREVVSFPVSRLREREEEFYRFGGMVRVGELEGGVRVPGVNKSLRLILPTEEGHAEVPVVGMESHVAEILGISQQTVEERVRVLTKRRFEGRSGLYVDESVPLGIPLEEALSDLARRKKGVRNRLEGMF